MKNQQSNLLLAYFKRKEGTPLTEAEQQAWEQHQKAYPVKDAFDEEAFEQLARYQRQMLPVEQFCERYSIPFPIACPKQKQDTTVRVRRLQRRYLAVAASLLLVFSVAAWWYFFNKAASLNLLQTARGQQRELVLPDGTKIWLNAATVIRYPAVFSDNVREITLEDGEAYFEVAKKLNQPFIVNIPSRTGEVEKGQKARITVLGTRFNIKAYKEEGTVTTTLEEGTVRVEQGQQQLVLMPGQQATIDQQGWLSASVINLKEVTAWKHKYFVFRDRRLSEIMAEVERWYDVDVIYLDPLSDERFVVDEFPRSKPVNELLENLEASRLVRFEVKGRKIYIRK